MSRHFEPTSLARDELTIAESVHVELRARQMGVYVIAQRSIRRNCWRVVITQGKRHAELFGKGPLAAVIDGAFQDFEALPEVAA